MVKVIKLIKSKLKVTWGWGGVEAKWIRTTVTMNLLSYSG